MKWIELDVIFEAVEIIKNNKNDNDLIIKQCNLIIEYAREIKNRIIDKKSIRV